MFTIRIQIDFKGLVDQLCAQIEAITEAFSDAMRALWQPQPTERFGVLPPEAHDEAFIVTTPGRDVVLELLSWLGVPTRRGGVTLWRLRMRVMSWLRARCAALGLDADQLRRAGALQLLPVALAPERPAGGGLAVEGGWLVWEGGDR